MKARLFKIDDNLYKLTSKDLRKMKPSDFGNKSVIYVTSIRGAVRYIITLKKEKYDTFTLETVVQNADTYKSLVTPGNGPSFRPYYIDTFLYRG